MSDARAHNRYAWLQAALAVLLAGCAATHSCPAPQFSGALDFGDGGNRALVGSGPGLLRRTLLSAPASEHAATDYARRGVLQRMVPPRLRVLAGRSHAKRAFILIGGINGTYHYFDDWIKTLTAADGIVFGWDHDHNSTKMAVSATMLAQDLEKLRAAGWNDVTIVAHSIGGLVAKGAVDDLSRRGAATGFRRLDLHAFGSPWGGFAVVKLVLEVPGSAAVSTAMGFPMAQELKPGSSYLVSLSRPMPHNGRLHLYVGNADSIALPVRSSTSNRYASIQARARTVTTIDGFEHNDYHSAPVLAKLVTGARNLGSCQRHACRMTLHAQLCGDIPFVVNLKQTTQVAAVE